MRSHLIESLSSIASTSTDPSDLARHARDWWPLAMLRERRGDQLEQPIAVIRPASIEEISGVLRICNELHLGVVPFGRGSGVCGGAQAASNVISLDLSRLNRVEVDDQSMTAVAQAGVLGSAFEATVNQRGFTAGHFPQSIDISTVGGWIATRGAGQCSTRYGRIDERVIGMSAVLADGSVMRAPARAGNSAGADVTRIFAGSEGTLGVIADVTLELEPLPSRTANMTFQFDHFDIGLEAMRQIMRTQARPAVLRLYDEPDAFISFRERAPGSSLLVVRCEGDDPIFEPECNLVAQVARDQGGAEIGPELADHWWQHKNDAVDSLTAIMFDGLLGPHAAVDTLEVSKPWPVNDLYRRVRDALREHADVVGCHASHPTRVGTCLYFTFIMSSAPDDTEVERRYRAAWSAAMAATMSAGGSITHHHGVGLLRAPWIAEEMGGSMDLLRAFKQAVDPNKIMNPGKAGL